MKVLVCGGRDYKDYDKVKQILDDWHSDQSISMIIHGAAKGADSMAGYWAQQNSINCLQVPAKWDLHGKSAGFKRNAEMLTFHPEMVIAFPGGIGTAMMKKLATEADIQVVDITG